MMIRKHEPRVPEGVDVTRPSIARIYDYLLFGKDNFAADRAAADELMQSRLDPRRLALANRAFLRRAVRFAARQGISQFLDLGSGLPTSPSVHECAREVMPGARVAYVDHDPIVVTHNDALLATRDGVITVRGDVREPDAVLGHDALRGCLDFGRPIAVLLLSVLHFISGDEDAPGIVARFRERMAPGSYLVVSIGTSDGADPEMLAVHPSLARSDPGPLRRLRPSRAGSGQPARVAAGLQHRPDAAQRSHRRRRGPAGGLAPTAATGARPGQFRK
jgi:hypothetical protein